MNVEYAIQSAGVDDRRLRVAANDLERVADVQIACGGQIFIEPGERERVRAAAEQERIQPRFGIRLLDRRAQTSLSRAPDIAKRGDVNFTNVRDVDAERAEQ